MSLVDEIKEKMKDNMEAKKADTKQRDDEYEFYRKTLNRINDLERVNLALQAQLSNATQDTLSTTQFFNPSLAKDFYNMTGNSLNTNSYMAIRQMIGIVNNQTPNVKQTIDGITINNTNGISSNGTGVGLSEAKQIQGWWLWIMILERIDYFANLFKIETEDKKLKKALKQYLFDVVLSGRACIMKKGEDYKVYCVTNVKINQEGDISDFSYYNSNFVINAEVSSLENNEGLMNSSSITDNCVVGAWKKNGYNIWFYIMSYLFNAVDLLYIYWNRARLNKEIVLQKKGNNSSSNQEAFNFLDPYQNLVTINSVSILDEDGHDNAKVELENRYEILSLGNGEETQYSFTNFLQWIDYWDNVIGIRSNPLNTNSQRSISNEIEPQVLKLSHLQQDFQDQLEYLADEIKEKFGVEVTFTSDDNVLIQQIQDNGGNPSFKDAGGNETENLKNNGE